MIIIENLFTVDLVQLVHAACQIPIGKLPTLMMILQGKTWEVMAVLANKRFGR